MKFCEIGEGILASITEFPTDCDVASFVDKDAFKNFEILVKELEKANKHLYEK